MIRTIAIQSGLVNNCMVVCATQTDFENFEELQYFGLNI